MLNRQENTPVESFDGFEFFPPLADDCQYSTMYVGDKPRATLQRRRVYERGPVWKLYALDGSLIRSTYLTRYAAVAKFAASYVDKA